jgi:hypothetical protein
MFNGKNPYSETFKVLSVHYTSLSDVYGASQNVLSAYIVGVLGKLMMIYLVMTR